MITNYHILTVKYLGATNTLPSRVKITSERFNQSIIINYNYSLNSITDMAADYLKKHGHYIIGKAEGKSCDYIIARAHNNSFKELK